MLNKRIDDYKSLSRLRHRYFISKRNDNIVIINGKNHINFSSNDYLGLSQEDEMKIAAQSAIETYGVGSTSSGIVSGCYTIQKEAEQAFANFLNIESALLFNTGYMANIGVMTAIADRHTQIVADKLCHASLLDGIRLSRAQYYRYNHNNMVDLKLLLKRIHTDYLVTESIFSMEGDITPIQTISKLVKETNGGLIIDDAHGIGVLGKNGIGIREQCDQDTLICLVVPLGKAFACMGCMVLGSKQVIGAILQLARTYHYTTAIPPAICATILTALKLVMRDQWRRDVLFERIDYFQRFAEQKGLNFTSLDKTPIMSIIIGSNLETKRIQRILLSKGMLVACIRPPTVPENTARLRISLNCLHSKEQITSLINCLSDLLC